MPGDFPQRPFFFRWEKPGFLLMDLKEERFWEFHYCFAGVRSTGGEKPPAAVDGIIKLVLMEVQQGSS